jgi:hypothetical protein
MGGEIIAYVSCRNTTVPKTFLFGTASAGVLDERVYGLLSVPKLIPKSKYQYFYNSMSFGTVVEVLLWDTAEQCFLRASRKIVHMTQAPKQPFSYS